MDLLTAVGDLGVTDPATDPVGAERARAGLMRELSRADAAATASRRRRAARRRSRGVLIGVPALVAAAVVAVALLSSGGSSSPGRHVARSRAGAPVSHNAAYVVRHVKAELISLEQGAGVVTSTVDYVGFPIAHDVIYTDPRSDALYQADRAETRNGRVLYVNVDESVPINGYEHFRTFSIDYTQHTWSTGSGVNGVPIQPEPAHPFTHPLAGARSTPAAVQRALSSHLETEVGTTTLDGVRTLVLRGTAGDDRITLYVDARTYQPLRETERDTSAKAQINQVTDVLPATAADIALAQQHPTVPGGYTFVAP